MEYWKELAGVVATLLASLVSLSILKNYLKKQKEARWKKLTKSLSELWREDMNSAISKYEVEQETERRKGKNHYEERFDKLERKNKEGFDTINITLKEMMKQNKDTHETVLMFGKDISNLEKIQDKFDTELEDVKKNKADKK